MNTDTGHTLQIQPSSRPPALPSRWARDDTLADTAAFVRITGCHRNYGECDPCPVEERAPEDMALCMVPATHRLDVNKVVTQEALCEEGVFAKSRGHRAITGMEIGGVTPIGLPTGVPVWVEASVMSLDYIILGGGNRISKLKVPPAVFELIDGCEIVEAAASLISISKTIRPPSDPAGLNAGQTVQGPGDNSVRALHFGPLPFRPVWMGHVMGWGGSFSCLQL